ncbi:NUDIX hydrolase [Anoxynatronum sibiricum]|uniref:NUDIX hydrolase n=1 Tax=Anoxynatronum sibiricum TaxID=210623 RepID=A0ABU9VQ74_9CLOT
MHEKTLKSARIYEGKIINVRVDTVELPDQKYSKREIVEHAGAAAVVPITREGEVILVKQFRKPVEDVLLEIPAGRLEPKESAENCAFRELLEETGYRAGQLDKLTAYFSSPGFSNEVIHLYLARDLTEGQAQPDEDEYLEITKIPLTEVLTMIHNGSIQDSKTIIGLLMAASRV